VSAQRSAFVNKITGVTPPFRASVDVATEPEGLQIQVQEGDDERGVHVRRQNLLLGRVAGRGAGDAARARQHFVYDRPAGTRSSGHGAHPVAHLGKPGPGSRPVPEASGQIGEAFDVFVRISMVTIRLPERLSGSWLSF
jgi:hypothetical protein